MSLLSDVIKRGTRASQPAATTVAIGTLYYVTDEYKSERSNGTTWDAFSGGSGAWVLVTSAAASGASVNFTGLAGYSEIMVMIVDVAATGSCIRQCVVSIDNGSNFLTSSGDYIQVDSSGAKTNATSLSFTNGNNATAQTAWITIKGFNLSTPKPVENGQPTTNLVAYIPTANALNALQVKASSNAFNAGTIYIYGRGI